MKKWEGEREIGNKDHLLVIEPLLPAKLILSTFLFHHPPCQGLPSMLQMYKASLKEAVLNNNNERDSKNGS